LARDTLVCLVPVRQPTFDEFVPKELVSENLDTSSIDRLL
jgi:hypothetical protein